MDNKSSSDAPIVVVIIVVFDVVVDYDVVVFLNVVADHIVLSFGQ